jgi:hypothetical protein
MSVDTFLFSINSLAAGGEARNSGAIPIALIDRIFSSRIDRRTSMGDTRFWRLSYPVDPAFIDGVPVFCGTELIFSDENDDGLTDCITFRGICGDMEFYAGLFELMRQTPTFYLDTAGARPVIVQPAMADALPQGLIDAQGPHVLIRSPEDFCAIPEAVPAPRPQRPPRIEEAYSYARSLQTRMQGRHRFHNLLRNYRARAEAAVTADAAVLRVHIDMLDAAISASWPTDDAHWMARVTTAVKRRIALDCVPESPASSCGDLAIDRVRADIARQLRELARGEAAIIAEVARLRAAGAVQIDGLDAGGLAKVMRRIGDHLLWRLPEGASELGHDLYLTLGDSMLDISTIERPQVGVGSLHDDIAELGKLLTDEERLVSPLDLERLAHVLLAMSARI